MRLLGKVFGARLSFCGIAALLSVFLCAMLAPGAARAQGTWHHGVSGSGNNTDIPDAALTDSNGNLVVAGLLQSLGTSGVSVVKYNAAGTLLWQHTAAVPGPLSPIYDNNIYIAKDSADDVTVVAQQYQQQSAVMLRYSSTGALLKSATFQFHNPADQPSGIVMDPSSGATYVYGTYFTTDSSGDYYSTWFVSQLNSNGAVVWTQAYIGDATGLNEATCAAVDSTGNIDVGGYTVQNGVRTFSLVRYDSSGDQLTNYDYANAIQTDGLANTILLDSSNNIYLGGSVNYSDGTGGMMVARFTAGGSLTWMETYGNTASGSIGAVTQLAFDTAGNIVVAGTSDDGGYNVLRTLLKYDTYGNQQWVRVTGKVGTQTDAVVGLFADPTGAASGLGGGFYTVEEIERFDSTLYQYITVITSTRYDNTGVALTEQDYTGSSLHRGDVNCYTAAFDATTGSLYTVAFANYAAAGSATPNYNWVIIKYLLGTS